MQLAIPMPCRACSLETARRTRTLVEILTRRMEPLAIASAREEWAAICVTRGWETSHFRRPHVAPSSTQPTLPG